MKKVMFVFGTRPEAIKMAPLIKAMLREPNYFNVSICVTAQHRLMLDQVMDTFDLTPDIDLNLMREGQNLADLTSLVIRHMGRIFDMNRPDIAVVHGDTSTTLAAAMAAFYTGISVAHVEAGLRTFNLSAPYPEEFNRQIVGRIARLHFAPTVNSRRNLLSEGINPEQIYVTGNTVIDSLNWVLCRLSKDRSREAPLFELLNNFLPFNWKKGCFILITGHRRENFGKGFQQICEGLYSLASRYKNWHFVYPVHLNPNVQNPVYKILGKLPNFHLIEPLSYEPFIILLKYCYLVITDSGGIQEEAPSLGKPVIVTRNSTERFEAVEAGTVKLVGSDKNAIEIGVSRLIEDEVYYKRMSQAINPYGDGNACTRIIEVLKKL